MTTASQPRVARGRRGQPGRRATTVSWPFSRRRGACSTSARSPKSPSTTSPRAQAYPGRPSTSTSLQGRGPVDAVRAGHLRRPTQRSKARRGLCPLIPRGVACRDQRLLRTFVRHGGVTRAAHAATATHAESPRTTGDIHAEVDRQHRAAIEAERARRRGPGHCCPRGSGTALNLMNERALFASFSRRAALDSQGPAGRHAGAHLGHQHLRHRAVIRQTPMRTYVRVGHVPPSCTLISTRSTRRSSSATTRAARQAGDRRRRRRPRGQL